LENKRSESYGGKDGLANTNVFTLFDGYKQFLLEKKPIEVLCLDPTDEEVVDNLDRLVAVAAEKYVLPDLISKVGELAISDEYKVRIKDLISKSSNTSATKTMIQVSLVAWEALGDCADKQEINSSRFLSVRLYQHPPSIKGWILGDHRVLRGDFSIPGYGLSEPVMLFDSERALSEVNNFKHAFQLLWTDTQTKSFSGVNASVNINILTENRFSMLDGCFYETSGLAGLDEALNYIPIKDNTRMLDIASGTGYFSVFLSKKLKRPSKIISVEKNSSLVNGFEKRLKSFGKDKEFSDIETICSDIHELELGCNSFDLIFCRNALHHFYDPKKIIEKIYAWLKPDGIAMLIDVISPPDKELEEFINKVAKLSNPENVKYYSYSELKDFVSPYKLEIIKEIETHDYVTPFRDYLRRKNGQATQERMNQFESVLLGANKKERKAFCIEGGDKYDLSITLYQGTLVLKKS